MEPQQPPNQSQSDNPQVTGSSTAVDAVPEPARKRLDWRRLFDSKLKIIVTSVSVFLLLGGGSAMAYYGYVVPNRPQNILRKSLATTFYNQDLQNARITADVTGLAGGKDIKAKLNGDISTSGHFDLAATLKSSVANVSVNAKSTNGKDTYVKFNGLPQLADFLTTRASFTTSNTLGQALLKVIPDTEGKWVQINQDLLDEAKRNSGGSSQADPAALAKLYMENEFFEVVSVWPDEIVNGVKSHHYTVKVNHHKMTAFSQKSKNLNMQGLQGLLVSLIKDRGESYQGFNVWIAKDTKYINKVMFKYFYSHSNQYDVTVNLSNHNKSFKVKPPANARPAQDILSESNLRTSELYNPLR